MNDSHAFSIDGDGLMRMSAFCFEQSLNKDIENDPAGSVVNLFDIEALDCRVDRSIVKLWQMIKPAVTEPGFELEGNHFTVPGRSKVESESAVRSG